MRGKFITIEGTEGVGKTTNIQFIQNWLESKQLAYLCTREPGGTPLAEQIRELLLAPREELVCDTAELLLMFAGRAQHLNQVIEPALTEGAWVLCDRFTDATYAYQGAGRGMGTSLIAELELIVQGSLRPDLTLILDIPVELGLKRASERSDPDRFEQEKTEFFDLVRNGYLDIARKHPDRCVVIDASQPLELVQRELTIALEAFWYSSEESG
ncbi:dTMP kinase [Porticoccaceae bacterium]|jgi:dTMP kinase|nr:dTMP kinase [SAR92 clade bacterium H231]MDA8936524.1 dTMP kinase [Porticoccaceae bacterium]MDA9559395.1 dTMP kinase [Porticoccaceae bacterium]MDB2549123.1 dTMP kinase [Porticoccaceae bacterium]MDG1200376.1 dTMP kinase [Porticoccaceae bacterium]